MSTESAEILHDLITCLLRANAWPIIQDLLNDKFDGRKDDLRVAVEELSEETGEELVFEMEELI
tara:strand:- start:754 stop:945 length:192 start_codon:yes stop_codon:yes gene_type:complete